MSWKGTLVARSKINATGGDRAEHEDVAESEMYVRFVNGNEVKASARQLWCVQIGYCHTVLRATIWSYDLELRFGATVWSYGLELRFGAAGSSVRVQLTEVQCDSPGSCIRAQCLIAYNTP